MAAASFKRRSPSGAMRQSKDERGKEKGSLGQEVAGKSKPSPGKQLEEQANQNKARLERQERELNACKARIEAKKKRDEEESAGKKELQIQVKKNRDLVQEEEYKSNQHLQKKRIAEKFLQRRKRQRKKRKFMVPTLLGMKVYRKSLDHLILHMNVQAKRRG